MSRQRLAILGATGSIGASTLDVVARHPDRFEVVVLAGGSRVEPLLALCRRLRPARAVPRSRRGRRSLRDGLARAGLPTQAQAGPEALDEAAGADDVDTVVAAIVGAAGMASTLAAARAGKRIVLANKESVVLAGALLMEAIEASGAQVLPVDSEHNAIFQCLPADAALRGGVRRVLLTASGGPFVGMQRSQLAAVTPEQACAHPNWSMGRKISVDSATLMNKGLEVIEAHWLFGLAPAQIDVVVHRQSIVHSLVDYVDGSMLAQLGNPDMRTAIACGLAWPERIESGVRPLDLAALGRLDFAEPDHATFPCLKLAWAALAAGGSAPAALSAANEIAVSAFLQGQTGFLDIPALLQATLDSLETTPARSLDAVLDADAQARRRATSLLPRFARDRPHATHGTH